MQLLFFLMAMAVPFSQLSYAQGSSEEPCGSVADIVKESILNGLELNNLDADLIYSCLKSVPFNKTAALTFIDTYNQTMMQFQSTTAYLKDPPPSYQQPAVDLNMYLTMIKEKAASDKYDSEYAFELDISGLVQSSHDGHFAINLGLTSVFDFDAPLNFISLSADGFSIPQIYIFEDMRQAQDRDLDWTPSPVHTINGQYAITYLTKWAATWLGDSIESHGDWNNLMWSVASQPSDGGLSAWSSTAFYTEERLEISFANGSLYSEPFTASISTTINQTLLTDVTNGQDFYDSFVAATPESTPTAQELVQKLTQPEQTQPTDSAATATANANPFADGWTVPQYPKPFLLMDNFGSKEGENEASASAYLIPEHSLAILSLPSFSFGVPFIQDFVNFVPKFITETKKAGAKRVLFDLQSNPGGNLDLAYAMFESFFPKDTPWSGNRMRFHDRIEDLGNLWSSAWENATATNQTDVAELLKDIPYVAQTQLSGRTSQNWDYWDEMSNPYWDNGDWFMETSLIDLDEVPKPWVNVSGPANDIQPFAVEDMAILTNGDCSSTCTLFVELFQHQKGVRSVVVGGLPEVGPMQVSSGVRGSQVYELDDQSRDIAYGEIIYPEYVKHPFPDVINGWGLNFLKGSFNLRDTIRENETFPQQFAYQAANCRIFFPVNSFADYSNLWSLAASAIFDDDSKCITGSINQVSALNPYFTDVCGPNAADCDLDEGAQEWGTSNATVYGQNFVNPSDKDAGKGFKGQNGTMSGVSTSSVVSPASSPSGGGAAMTSTAIATSGAKSPDAPKGDAAATTTSGLPKPASASVPTGTASSSASGKSASPSQANAASTSSLNLALVLAAAGLTFVI